jgi:hypothetical protein
MALNQPKFLGINTSCWSSRDNLFLSSLNSDLGYSAQEFSRTASTFQ